MSFSKHTFGSLFAGVGGFDMGFEQAGWDCKFQVEWDKHCQSVLNRHWPDVPKWGDVSETSGHELPAVDCIIFGSPCQDLSVAGKRAGLEGERSGLFHEAMRIIKEMRDATNGTFPRWIVWENVAGAFSSNKGADFGTVLDEMAEAGAMAIEWALLDAQHFGVPQRRRRVFVVACFDPATADRCPDPLLPVSESLRGDSQKGRKTRKATTGETGASLASGGGIANTISAELYHRSTIVNQDVNNGHLVLSRGILGSDIVGSLNTSDAKMISTQYVNENKCVVEPFVKSRRPQSSTDDETWVPAEVNPTLNAFDVGDTRATTAIIEPILSFDTQFGSNADVFSDLAPPLKASQQSPSILGIQGNVIGRQPHNGPAGKGYTDEGDPMFTLTSTDVHAVAYPIQDGREIEKRQNGFGISDDGEPSYTLDQTGAQAVAYDEYNDRLGGEIHHALRAGTKQSTGVMVEAAGFKPGASANAQTIGYEEGLSPSLEAGGGGNNRPAVLEPTMAVRRLTPVECERLMGWPDDHTRWTADGKEQSDTHRYKQCGNGVATPVARWIADHMRRVDEIQ